MNVADFAVPLLAFGLVVNSVYAGLKTGFKRKEIIELVISFLMLGFSWWIASQNSDTFKSINEKNDLLKQDVSELLRQRRSDSADNFNFQKYLKDTFGIEKKGDTAIIVNNTVFIQQALVQKEDQTYTALPDSLNVNVNFKDNILRVSPKEKVGG